MLLLLLLLFNSPAGSIWVYKKVEHEVAITGGPAVAAAKQRAAAGGGGEGSSGVEDVALTKKVCKRTLVLVHDDLIGDAFWREHPELCAGE